MKINKIFPLFYLLYSKKEKRALASKYILPFFNYRKKGNNNFENNNFLSGNSIHERSKIQKYSNIFEEKEERMIRTFPYSNPLTTSPQSRIQHRACDETSRDIFFPPPPRLCLSTTQQNSCQETSPKGITNHHL